MSGGVLLPKYNKARKDQRANYEVLGIKIIEESKERQGYLVVLPENFVVVNELVQDGDGFGYHGRLEEQAENYSRQLAYLYFGARGDVVSWCSSVCGLCEHSTECYSQGKALFSSDCFEPYKHVTNANILQKYSQSNTLNELIETVYHSEKVACLCCVNKRGCYLLPAGKGVSIEKCKSGIKEFLEREV